MTWWDFNASLLMPIDGREENQTDVERFLLSRLHENVCEGAELAHLLIALARVWTDGNGLDPADVFGSAVSSSSLQVRNAAILGLGICQDARSAPVLIEVIENSKDKNIRAVSFVALGFLLTIQHDRGIHEEAAELLLRSLSCRGQDDESVLYGAIFAAGALRRLRGSGACSLKAFEKMLVDLHRSNAPVKARAIVLPSLARLALNNKSKICADHCIELSLLDLARRSPVASRVEPTASSAAIAMGLLVDPSNDSVFRALKSCIGGSNSDPYTRHEALIAIARIGGVRQRKLLMETLTSVRSSESYYSSVLALGLLEQRRLMSDQFAVPDTSLYKAIIWAMPANDETALMNAARGVALARIQGALPDLRRSFEGKGVWGSTKDRDAVAASVGEALGWLGDSNSRDILRLEMKRSRRSLRVWGVALGLQRLGDEGIDRMIRNGIRNASESVAGNFVGIAGQCRISSVILQLELIVVGRKEGQENLRMVSLLALGDIAGWRRQDLLLPAIKFINVHAASSVIIDLSSGIRSWR